MSAYVIRMGWGEYVAVGEYLPDSTVRDGKVVELDRATRFTKETLPKELQAVSKFDTSVMLATLTLDIDARAYVTNTGYAKVTVEEVPK